MTSKTSQKSQSNSSEISSEDMNTGEELDNLLTILEEEDLTDMDFE